MADAPTTTISPVVVKDYALYCAMVNAGASTQDAVTMTAIGLAESGGNAAAISPLASDGSRGYGLWQIEYPTHSDLFVNGLGSGNWIFIENNASMAMTIKNSQGLGAWTTHQTGAYLAFMARALEAQATTLALAKAKGMTTAAFITGTCKDTDASISPVVLSVALAGDLGAAATAGAQAAGNAAGQFAGLYQPYSGPQAGNPLLRVVEIFLGAVLLVAGLKALTAPVTAPIGRAVADAAKLAVI